MGSSLYRDLSDHFGPRPDALTRRQMLQASVAAGAAMLLSTSGVARAIRRPAGGRRVVVVGAGLAGLACAYELSAVGYEVMLLDARDRVGGRTLTLSAPEQNELIPGRTLESGGEFIGSNHALWLAYARTFHLELDEVPQPKEPPTAVYVDGKQIDAAGAAKLFEDMHAAFGQLNAMAAKIDPDRPWISPDAEKLDARTLQSWIDGLDASAQVKAACRASLMADNCVDPDAASLLGQLVRIKGGGMEEFWTERQRYRCRSGTSMLAAGFLGLIGLDHMTLNAPVTRVVVKGSELAVSSGDGQTFACDDLVLATPPGTWSGVRFDPALPGGLRPQMGVSAKCLIYMKRRFWKEAKLSGNTLSDGSIQRTWDSTDTQVGDNDACLTAFAGGPGAINFLNVAPAQREEDLAKQLSTRFPGYAKNYVSAELYDWSKDPYIRGTQSFPAPGQVTAHGPIMEAGAVELDGRPRIHFAGEHVCYKFGGTMEGALQSGVAVAKRLAKRDGAGK